MPTPYSMMNVRQADADRITAIIKAVEEATGQAPHRVTVLAAALDALERELADTPDATLGAVWAAVSGGGKR